MTKTNTTGQATQPAIDPKRAAFRRMTAAYQAEKRKA